MTTPTYKDLLKQRDELAAQIEEARKREVGDAVAKVRTIIAEYELTPDQVFAPLRKRAVDGDARAKVEPKYIDTETQKTWTGRGKPPAWIAGKDRSLFEIKA